MLNIPSVRCRACSRLPQFWTSLCSSMLAWYKSIVVDCNSPFSAHRQALRKQWSVFIVQPILELQALCWECPSCQKIVRFSFGTKESKTERAHEWPHGMGFVGFNYVVPLSLRSKTMPRHLPRSSQTFIRLTPLISILYSCHVMFVTVLGRSC